MITTQLLGYRDFSYAGPQSGATTTITVDQVVRNATKMLLFSKLGDYGRDVTKGGVLISAIGKSLDQITANTIKKSIEEAMAQLTAIVPTTIDVVFLPKERAWRVHIVFVDTLNKFVSSLDLLLEG